MKPQEIYAKLFTALMENGYYDPTEYYAEKNTRLLQSLTDDMFDGVFWFKLKTHDIFSTLQINSRTNIIKIVAFIVGLEGPKAIKEIFIDTFSQRAALPTLIIDEDGDINCIHYVLEPYNSEQLINVLGWFDVALDVFIEQYQQVLLKIGNGN